MMENAQHVQQEHIPTEEQHHHAKSVTMENTLLMETHSVHSAQKDVMDIVRRQQANAINARRDMGIPQMDNAQSVVQDIMDLEEHTVVLSVLLETTRMKKEHLCVQFAQKHVNHLQTLNEHVILRLENAMHVKKDSSLMDWCVLHVRKEHIPTQQLQRHAQSVHQ